MCGLIGWSLPADMTMKASDLDAALCDLMSRGTDATGIAGWGKGSLWYSKKDVPAHHFGFDAKIPGRTGIGHTRAATTGSERVNYNNHPIHCGNIVGAHNGMLWGHRSTANRLGLDLKYEVDSELLFRVLEHTDDHKLRIEMMERIEGDATILWLDTQAPDVLYAAAMGGRPAVYLRTTDGRFAVGSCESAVMESLGMNPKNTYTVDDCGSIPEGEMWTIIDGEIVDKSPFASVTWMSYGKVDTSRANGPGKSSGVIGSPQKPPTGKRGSRRMAAPTALYDLDQYAEVEDVMMAVYDFIDTFNLDGPWQAWHVIRNTVLPKEASDLSDSFCYEIDDAQNKVYLANTPDGWKPVTRRTVESAIEFAFDEANSWIPNEYEDEGERTGSGYLVDEVTA